MKKFIWTIIIILILGGAYYLSTKNKDKVVKVDDSLACYSFTSGNADIKDLYTLELNTKGNSAFGELKFLPAEKDSKVGKFDGLISSSNENPDVRVVAAWWEAMGEGMKNREQLAILLEGEKASIGFGEMIKANNGDYVYANPEEVSYSLSLEKVDCLSIN